jgi:hypothetical protein
LDLNATLRQVRDSVIAVECSACGRSGQLDRATLLKKHGASVTFARLRRMAAMGCGRLVSLDGDRCQTRFPCLARCDGRDDEGPNKSYHHPDGSHMRGYLTARTWRSGLGF